MYIGHVGIGLFAAFLICAIICAFLAMTGYPNKPRWVWGEAAMFFYLVAVAIGCGVIYVR